MQRTILAGIGFILGLALAAALEGMLLLLIDGMSGQEMIPRGLGWLAIPVMSALAGARGFPVLMDRALSSNPAMMAKLDTRHRRFMIVGAAGWAIVFVVYWVTAQPYGYSMRGDDWAHFFELLIIPAALYLGIYVAALWATSAPQR